MKKIIAGIVIIVLLLVIAVILAPFVIDLNKYREPIIKKVEEQLHRDVDFKSMDLALFGGIGAEIEGFKIADNPEFSQDDFISLDSLEVYLEFLPLLKKQVRVKKIVLVRPYVSVHRDARGRFNFDDLTNKKGGSTDVPGKKPSPPSSGTAQKQEAAQSPMMAVFAVKDLTVRQAKVVFKDEILFKKKPPVVIEGIDLDMENISLEEAIGIDLKACVLGSGSHNIRLSGSIGPIVNMESLPKTPFDLQLSSEELPLVALPIEPPLDVLSGKVQIEAAASGSPKGVITSEGRLALNNLVLKDRPDLSGIGSRDIPGKEIVLTGPAQYHLALNTNGQGLSLEADADMKGMRIAYGEDFDKPSDMPLSIAFKGDLNSGLIQAHSVQVVLRDLVMDGSGSADISGKTPEMNIKLKTAPVSLKGWGSLVPEVKAYDLEGSAELAAEVSGPVDDLAINLTASSKTASFAMPDSSKDGTAAAKSKAVLDGTEVKINARRQKDVMKGIVLTDIKKGMLRDVAFEDLSGQFQMTPEDLSIKSFKVKVFDGSVSTTGRYMLQSGKWTASPVFEGIASGTLLDTLTSFKGIFSGMFSGDFKLSGPAKDLGINAIDASGSFALKNGIWNNFDLAGTVMDDFWQIKEMAEQAGASREKIDLHNKTSFDLLQATFTMSKGQILLNPVVLNNIRTSQATDSIAQLKGIVDMNTRALDFKGEVTLSQKQSADLVRRTPALSALQDKHSRIVLPVRIKGTLVKPLLTLDTKNINDAFARYYTRKGVKRLQEKYGIPGGTDGTEEMVEELLNGILGK